VKVRPSRWPGRYYVRVAQRQEVLWPSLFEWSRLLLVPRLCREMHTGRLRLHFVDEMTDFSKQSLGTRMQKLRQGQTCRAFGARR